MPISEYIGLETIVEIHLTVNIVLHCSVQILEKPQESKVCRIKSVHGFT